MQDSLDTTASESASSELLMFPFFCCIEEEKSSRGLACVCRLTCTQDNILKPVVPTVTVKVDFCKYPKIIESLSPSRYVHVCKISPRCSQKPKKVPWWCGQTRVDAWKECNQNFALFSTNVARRSRKIRSNYTEVRGFWKTILYTGIIPSVVHTSTHKHLLFRQVIKKYEAMSWKLWVGFRVWAI